MSINLTDEIEVKTKKGKLGAAKQIFLEGDTQTVEKEIQDINSKYNDLNSKHESLSSIVSEHTNQIESNQSQITANKSAQDAKNTSLDANMAKLNTRDDQITELVRGVTATGGASVATAVTYDNTSSHIASATVQGAIDEVSSIGHFAKRGGIVNISTNYNSTNTAEVLNLYQAIAKVPSKDRVLGFSGTYLSSIGWEQIQFIGNSISEWSDSSKWKNQKSKLSIKTVVLPQSNKINIDLNNNKVIISECNLYITTYNTNNFSVSVGSQIIDISDKLSANSALLFNTKSNSFEFLNFLDQGSVNDDYCIVALLNNRDIYYVSCDIYVNGERFGPINAQNKVKDILHKIDSLEAYDSLGDLYGNMVTGSDLMIGYNNSDWNFNALSIEGVNANIVREFSTEISKYVFKVTVNSGSNVATKYCSKSIRSFNVNIPQGQKFYVGVRYKINKSSSSIPFSLAVLANDYNWLTGLSGINSFFPIIDGKWHYKTFEVSLDSAAITKVGFVIFLSANSPYTYEEDCSIEFTDLLLSMSKVPEYSLQKNEKEYAALNEYDNIQSLKSNGILWSNLVKGSDMEKGYEQANILAFSTYPTLGGTVERVLDNETSRYCIKAHFPTGTEFTNANNYVYPSLMKDVIFTGEDTTQEFSISFRYKCSPNFIGFCPLCNGIWMQYLRSDGAWRNLTPNYVPLVKDNNWHYAHIVTRKTDVSNKTYSVGLYAYLAAGSAVTLEEGLDFCITDIVISPSRFTDFSNVKNPNDFGIDTTEGNLTPIVNNIISKYPDAHGCVFMSLGDSITTEGYYIDKLRQLLEPSKYYNLAVASATWADRTGTTSYDGNPQFTGDQNQNVLGNQIQKIINNPNVYNVAPDIIIISAGTNDGNPILANKTDYEMRVEIDSHFNENFTTPIQVTEPTFDDGDTFKEHRRTIAGAMRYCVLKLQSMYPNARIYILTPIQGSYSANKDYLTQIEVKQRYITEVAKHLSVPVIHVGEECGINRDFEYGGTYWKREWDPQNRKTGRDLIDGLHPNTSGSWKMAKYIARKLLNDYVNQSY